MRITLISLLLTSLAACSFFKKKNIADADVIARVNDEYLYASDILSLTKGMKSEDSVNALKNYAESWVRKKLLLQKAIENIDEDDAGITRKIEDYRESLLLYEYEKALIYKKLDTVIKAEELDTLYEQLKNNFPLKQDVFQLFFIKIKKDAPDLNDARKWITKPKDEEDAHKLEGYCKEFATSYSIDNGMWYERENILKNFPLNEGDINSLAASKKFREFKVEDGFWFIRVADVLKKDQPSPLEFIRENIAKVIIEKRRLQLIEKTYDKIYQDGIKTKSFEILVQ